MYFRKDQYNNVGEIWEPAELLNPGQEDFMF